MRAAFFAFWYQLVRSSLLLALYHGGKPDLESVIKRGDYALAYLQRWFGRALFYFNVKSHLSTQVYDLTFRTPILFSSFKDDLSLIQIWLDLGVGGGIFKTVMLNEREGNLRPRIQQVVVDDKTCLYNAMGLPGKGVKSFLKQLQEVDINAQKAPIAFSVGGENKEEYIAVVEAIESASETIRFPFFYELNISCPNTEEGQDMMKYTTVLSSLIKSLRERTNRVISVKLSPDLKNQKLIKLVETIRPFSKMMVNVGNTQFKTPIEVGLKSRDFSMPGGGLSGAVLLSRTLEMVALLAPLGVPLIATGGISTIEDVREAQSRGAVLCGMATALVQNPYCLPQINAKLSK